MSSLLYLIATRPELLVDHAEAYAGLASAEVSHASAIWKRRATLGLVAFCSFTAATVLAGVAVMLWAVFQTAGNPALWTLILTPICPTALGIWCLLAMKTRPDESAFSALRRQVKADMAVLREATGP